MKRRFHAVRGFTLLELMVALGVIMVLVSILVPVVARIRRAAQATAAKNQISQLQGAIERFHLEQGSYPGPLPDGYLSTTLRGTTAPPINDASGGSPLPQNDAITSSENLVLGLLGGLKWVNSGGMKLCYDPDMVGKGMIGMKPNQAKKAPYIDKDAKMLSAGKYSDGAGTANDSPIPELLDSAFPNPMPILYLRAHTGATGVVSDNTPETLPLRSYVLSDVLPYTGSPIGEGKSIRVGDYRNAAVAPSPGVFPHGLQSVVDTAVLDKNNVANYRYPYDLYPYLLSPTSTASVPVARSANSYILISAGPDRVYGTADDICSFGDIAP